MNKNNKIKGIYIHIPFCRNICYYCDFNKVIYNDELANNYLIALAYEIKSSNILNDDIETIYIGGGTPSCLSYRQLVFLFSLINISTYPNIKEFNIELNPEDVNEELVSLLIKNKITRVSIGVQSFNDNVLKECHRLHNKNDVINAISLLRKNGISNINIDLMYGFNTQSIDNIKHDLTMIEQLAINHVSYYNLIVEPGTVFYNNNYQESDLDNEYLFMINDYLINNLGFENYEVSNYCKNKEYSKHNLLYWHNEHYYGFGLGACSYINNQRIYNTKSITNYNKLKFNKLIENYSYKELLENEILLQFRLFNGIDLNEISKKYSFEFTNYFKNAIIKNMKNIMIINNKLYFNNKAKLFLNDIILDFIECIGEIDND
ncbi:MAG: radical SAM family heme chaperone HemW [Bacilli bacterium]|jgi:oxygen-independent coproporphyrinogen-3 oxidase|nr:radical SAM family heme chaperone HemW [Bacilli bacterium]